MEKYLLFGSPTCQPCKAVKAALSSLDFKFEYVDVTERPDLAGEHMVMSTPTMIKFVEDKPVKSVIGQSAIMSFVDGEKA